MPDGLSGGDALAARLKEISERVNKKAEVRIGFLEGATYPRYAREDPAKLRAKYSKKKALGDDRAIKGDVGGQSVAMVAAVQEFGSPEKGIPPRPFFRTMIAQKSPEWGNQLANLLELNNYDVDRSLGLMGEGIKGQLQQSIIDTNEPALSEYAINKKGFSKPLIDTGHMLASVDYEVKS